MADYRNMSLEDEDAVFDLWARTWRAPSGDVVRARAGADDPDYLEHTFVAVEDGTLLATWRYFPRLIKDAAGKPRPVGCVASVVTVESARRQGHARRLVQLGHEAMRREGCDWAFLFSSKMGVPLYASLGYSAFTMPFHRGRLSGKPEATGEFVIEQVAPHFNFEGDAGQAVRHIYAEYNALRPLALVRDESYWRNRFNRRMEANMDEHTTTLFLATRREQKVGYLLAHYSTEAYAREKFNLDQVFTLSEIGLLRGHEAASGALLSAALDKVSLGEVGGTSVLPHEEPLESQIRLIFGESLYMFDDRRMMAFPLGENITHDNISAIFNAPGAISWLMDDF